MDVAGAWRGRRARCSVRFGDGKLLWESGVMKAGEAPKPCDVALTGVRTLLLEVGEAGDGKAQDHADWAEAKFETTAGAVLETSKAPPPGLLTPPVPATPRINGARVVGVRPGNPCLYTITASGERPMRFAANNLPQGLKLDPQTGRLTGTVAKDGDLEVWAKEMEDGSRAVGLFNRGRRPAAVTAFWKDLGITGPQQVRDLWRQQDLTVAKDAYRAEVPGHGCVLLRIGGKQTR
ncbi:MAG: NPCBM/NEW2 domain-containing protein [Verrucomicrobia bacterium]|nr:NPCBM/NEW2 domain-containing protein [Verrucomicrobiota bacterium]